MVDRRRRRRSEEENNWMEWYEK